MLQIWDVVGFDEVADLQKMPKEIVTMLKTYCESGQFQRGQESMAGYASLAMFGNTQQPIDVMVQSGHLFAPMPDVIRDDMAFIDRLLKKMGAFEYDHTSFSYQDNESGEEHFVGVPRAGRPGLDLCRPVATGDAVHGRGHRCRNSGALSGGDQCCASPLLRGPCWYWAA